MTGETRKPITDAEEFFRQQEARLAWEERRPQVTRAADLMGPGLGPRAIEITDFDSELASFNGFYYAAPGALNSPDDTKWWMGYTISPRTEAVGGIQVFWTFREADAPHREMMRGFETSITASGAHTYGDWQGTPYPTILAYSSSTTFEKADYPGMSAVRVRLVGGGGGGGGASGTAAGQASIGAGGGGGGYSEAVIPVEDLSASETVTVGSGGSGGPVGNNSGNNGGTSSYGAHLSATGGSGGSGCGAFNATNFVNGGNGGLGSGGQINTRGDDGGKGVVNGGVPTLGNVGGGTALAGQRGGPSAFNSSGRNGWDYGGGASGGTSTNGAPGRAGGSGGTGRVIVEVLY